MSIDLATIKQTYHDNCDYVIDGDLVKARAFEVACMRLLAFRTTKSGFDKEVAEFSVEALQRQLDEVKLYRKSRGDSPMQYDNVRQAAFMRFRG